MHGSMSYMEKPRDDIRKWMPDAKSVLMCAFPYPAARRGLGPARVARYAAGPDYHLHLRERLGEIRDWAMAQESRAVVFIDTSPILERMYARLAGVGWVGKNAMIVSPKLGSYFLLGGVALDRELPPDEPLLDHCGTCNRCIPACPTDAFPKEKVVDATKCISYLTLEHRGPIPESLREGVGTWVAGCDLCQEVCPWNRFAPPGDPPLDTDLELEPLVTQERFRELKKTPLGRIRRRRLLRNALLAMGNARDKKHAEAVRAYVDDPDPVIAEQARWSLSRLV